MLYGIFHKYYVDGGFGDGILDEDLLFIVTDEEQARKYCEKWDNKHVYDIPYDELTCGKLYYKSIKEMSGNMWMTMPPHMIENRCAWAFDKTNARYSDEEERRIFDYYDD